MIKEVIKLDDGVWLINKSVKVYNLSVEDNGDIFTDIEFNESMISAEEAQELADELVSRGIKAKQNEAEAR